MHAVEEKRIPEGKRPLERRRPRWENNTKVDVKGICLEEVNWIGLAQNKGKWTGIMKMVIKCGFHNKQGMLWLAGELLTIKNTLFCIVN
jgi:hypothetical protein